MSTSATMSTISPRGRIQRFSVLPVFPSLIAFFFCFWWTNWIHEFPESSLSPLYPLDQPAGVNEHNPAAVKRCFQLGRVDDRERAQTLKFNLNFRSPTLNSGPVSSEDLSVGLSQLLGILPHLTLTWPSGVNRVGSSWVGWAVLCSVVPLPPVRREGRLG